ncbi:MAG: L-threonylcarbamoyladenylate synthase [Cyclobacteriaceae bacterium]
MARTGTDIDHAIFLLKSDALVAIPTETVYGLAGNALSEKAILEIYKTKNRPKFDPLIAHTNSMDKVAGLVKIIPENAQKLAAAFWPGPLTLLLEKSEKIPDLLTSGLPRVAVRIPNHPLTLELLERIDFPLAAPSANPFGYVSPTEASHVLAQLGNKIEYVLDGGKCKVGLESTIVGFERDQVIIHRLGGMKVEEIERVAGKVKFTINKSSNPVAPGMLKSHYSPGRPVVPGDIESNLIKNKGKGIGIISFRKVYTEGKINITLSPSGNLDEAAANIFQALRQMDNPDIELVLTEFVPNEGLGMAINDRLKRAAV